MYKSVILMMLLVSVSAFYAYAVDKEDLNFKISFESSEGTVVFDHGAHAFGRVKDCAVCHGALDSFGGEVNELFAHNFCEKCHASCDAPTDCTGCHSR